MHQTSFQSSLISTSSVRRELNRALAFEKPPNGPMRDRIMVDILKIDENDFKGTISPIEAKNLIYINTLGLDRNLLHGLDISFKGHPVITYRLREQSHHQHHQHDTIGQTRKLSVGFWRRKNFSSA